MALIRIIAASAFVGLIIIMTGCAYNKKEVVQIPCTVPDTVTYTAKIEPIIRTNCYACHSAGNNVANVLLDSYSALKSYAQNGYLYGVISHANGYKPMPDGGDKLDDCTIAVIKKWIDTGTPEN
ncbi:MAG: hypothetical protein JST39_03555 [Bacteroidetes bacterium]|nr:hypothetical protein [Bacteroidota bacterium]